MEQGKINYCLHTFVTSLEHANLLLWTLKSGLAACSVHRYMFGGLGDSAAMWLHVAGVRECKCYLKFESWLIVATCSSSGFAVLPKVGRDSGGSRTPILSEGQCLHLI